MNDGPRTGLDIDPVLLSTCINGTIEGLEVAGVVPNPVGASRFITGEKELSVLVSLYGERGGTVFLNLSRPAGMFLASHMLGEESIEFSEDLMDCLCEVGNIVAGRFKDILNKTEYRIDQISLPALILGANYNLYHSRGLVTASVTFELPEMPMEELRGRFFTTSISLMRR